MGRELRKNQWSAVGELLAVRGRENEMDIFAVRSVPVQWGLKCVTPSGRSSGANRGERCVCVRVCVCACACVMELP